MKTNPKMHEGAEAFTRFTTTMKAVLAVPHSEIQKRIEDERKKSAKNPTRPGPKRKPVKASASGRASKPTEKT